MDENNFSKACIKGDLTLAKDLLAKYLLTLRPISDIFANNAETFQRVCANDYLDMAKWLLEITPTIDISICEKAFHVACSCGSLKVAKWLLEIHSTINISAETFRVVCGNDYLDIAKWLLEITPTIDISICEDAFRLACRCGSLKVAKWLLEIHSTINISADNEYAFRAACFYDYLPVINWLLHIKPNIDIRINDDEAFRDACENGAREVAKLLRSINPNYKFKYNKDGSISYKITKHLPMHSEIIYIDDTTHEDRECMICKERHINLQTNCKHNFCTECICEWYMLHNTCPYCRVDINVFKTVILSV